MTVEQMVAEPRTKVRRLDHPAGLAPSVQTFQDRGANSPIPAEIRYQNRTASYDRYSAIIDNTQLSFGLQPSITGNSPLILMAAPSRQMPVWSC